MYAIIESCGRQYKVTEGDVVFFEKLEAEEGKKVTFDNVVGAPRYSTIVLGLTSILVWIFTLSFFIYSFKEFW